MIELVDHSNPHSWIIIGLILILIETFVISGIGFLFAGIAAFITGSLVIFGIIDNSFYSELACFLSISVVSAILLWVPMRNLNKTEDKIQNIIGERAIVIDEKLEHNKIGKVKWSGTIFNARIIDENIQRSKGEEVEIIEIKGNILIVK